MIVDVWRASNTDIKNIKPDTEVYTMILDDKNNAPLLCDYAWTSSGELSSHFWYSVNHNNIQIIKMTAYEYIKRHKSEIFAMNPFWEIGRLKFLAEWAAFHMDEIDKFLLDKSPNPS